MAGWLISDSKSLAHLILTIVISRRRGRRAKVATAKLATNQRPVFVSHAASHWPTHNIIFIYEEIIVEDHYCN